MKAKTLEQCTIAASGSFLTEYLPDNFEAMDEEVLYELIESIAWEPFENFSGKDLMKEIAGSGSTIFRDQPDLPPEGTITLTYTPEELGMANADHFEYRMRELAQEVIQQLNVDAGADDDDTMESTR
jgi:hypothetical protein